MTAVAKTAKRSPAYSVTHTGPDGVVRVWRCVVLGGDLERDDGVPLVNYRGTFFWVIDNSLHPIVGRTVIEKDSRPTCI